MLPYQWIVIVCGIFACLAAAGIGANDVANSYASSIGARSLTMKQAIFLASIFEFVGALAGVAVADTIRGGIGRFDCYVRPRGVCVRPRASWRVGPPPPPPCALFPRYHFWQESAPELLMYGNMIVDLCVAVWLFVAS